MKKIILLLIASFFLNLNLAHAQIYELIMKSGNIFENYVGGNNPGDSTKCCANVNDNFKILKIHSNDKYLIVECTQSNLENNCCVSENSSYLIKKELFEQITKKKFEFSAGIVSIPFKYQFKDNVFASGGILGGYLGNKIGIGIKSTVNIGFFAGFSILVADNQNAQKDGVETVVSFTYGIPLILGFGKSWQTGVVLGSDFSSNSNWNPWISFAIGYNFIKDK